MKCLAFLIVDIYCYDIMFLKQYHAGHEVVIHNTGPLVEPLKPLETFNLVAIL